MKNLGFENLNNNQPGLATGKDVFLFLKKTGFVDFANSPEEFKKWFKDLSFEDYKSHLTRLNGILTNLPVNKRLSYDDKYYTEINRSVRGTSNQFKTVFPYPEDRDSLMRKSFNAIKKIENSKDMASLAYYAILAIHPFFDGNGRTARLLYQIFSREGTVDEDSLSKFLDHDIEGLDGVNRERKTFNENFLLSEDFSVFVNREVAKVFLGEDLLKKYGSIGFNMIEQVEQKETKKDVAIFSNRDIIFLEKVLLDNYPVFWSAGTMAVIKFLTNKNRLDQLTLPSTVLVSEKISLFSEDFNKEILQIDIYEFIDQLTSDDLNELVEIHREIKRIFIDSLIDIYLNPENHLFLTTDNTTINIKNAFYRNSDQRPEY